MGTASMDSQKCILEALHVFQLARGSNKGPSCVSCKCSMYVNSIYEHEMVHAVDWRSMKPHIGHENNGALLHFADQSWPGFRASENRVQGAEVSKQEHGTDGLQLAINLTWKPATKEFQENLSECN